MVVQCQSCLSCSYDINKRNSSMKKALEDRLESECAAWLLDEMAANRRRTDVEHKVYDQTQMLRTLQEGGECERHWGCDEFLQYLRKNPHLLPQLPGS